MKYNIDLRRYFLKPTVVWICVKIEKHQSWVGRITEPQVKSLIWTNNTPYSVLSPKTLTSFSFACVITYILNAVDQRPNNNSILSFQSPTATELWSRSVLYTIVAFSHFKSNSTDLGVPPNAIMNVAAVARRVSKRMIFSYILDWVVIMYEPFASL